ncbi:hypothetical protein MINTM001_17250 [Mycobacterium paraintracellulare]|nr:hypothetical protein [Mycobacterium paraintracellulare]BCO40586.1 hypothetical protein MINTM001_17250 [Mycobacterium paraintracellulare]
MTEDAEEWRCAAAELSEWDHARTDDPITCADTMSPEGTRL